MRAPRGQEIACWIVFHPCEGLQQRESLLKETEFRFEVIHDDNIQILLPQASVLVMR